MTDDLTDRASDVLRALVREHIATGAPVGSSQLARTKEFEVSSATLRNVMADLEELGFLDKPHTSAGRVPTNRAYRFFVDSLVRLKEPGVKDREIIEQGIPRDTGVEESLQEATRILHFLTRHAGLVLTPRSSEAVFERIELVRLRENRVLAVLVGKDGTVQNKLITVDFTITAEELVRAGNYLNELLGQMTFDDIRGRIQTEMDQNRAQYDGLVQKALKLGFAATAAQSQERVLIEGTGSFLDAPEFADVERARTLFHALEEKGRLMALLDRVQRARELQIFIGAESELSPGGDVTLIASPYGTTERALGTVGVIGPTRMNYSRVIPLVNFTAQVLGKVIEEVR